MSQSSALLVKLAGGLHWRFRRISLALYRRQVPSSLLNAVLYPTYIFQFLVRRRHGSPRPLFREQGFSDHALACGLLIRTNQLRQLKRSHAKVGG